MGLKKLFGGEGSSKAAKSAANLESHIAKKQWDMYKEIYAPLERNLALETQNYDTPQAYERGASEASATVGQQFGKMYDRLGRVPGLDTSTPAYTAALANLNLGQGLADVAAQNAARSDIRNTSYQRKAMTASIGRGIPGTSMSGLGDSSRNLLNISNSIFDKNKEAMKAIGEAGGQIISGGMKMPGL